MNAPGPSLPDRAAAHAGRTAVVDAAGAHDYEALTDAADGIAAGLLERLGGRADLEGERIAFLAPPSAAWPALLFGIWRGGGVAVPLSPLWPGPESARALEETGAAAVVATPDLEAAVADVADRLGVARWSAPPSRDRPAVLDGDGSGTGGPLPEVGPGRAAMILFTSGTTSRPKGVVHTHGSLAAQVDALVEAWGWSERDRLLHVLPLHHVHGIVNGLLCALSTGAACDVLPAFDAEDAWRGFVERPVTLFMAVPTIYGRLIASWEAADAEERAVRSEAASRQRLMVSGSAALPVPVLETWREITGQTLLERYGMTEIGMALSNPLEGERRPGTVGFPLPGVRVRLVDGGGREIEAEGVPGGIEVAGPALFREYWRRPGETAASWRDGWFVTGDEAVVEDGYWRILGRSSVDIVKSGGEKVSALEVESALRGHPAVAEVAVVGVPDPEWGERVAAAIVLKNGPGLDLPELRAWAKERIAAWKIPTRLEIVDDLPKNAMGKVTKPDVKTLFEPARKETP